MLLDTRGVILAASQVAAQRLDKSLEEIIGADAFALVPPELGRKRFEIFQQVVATGSPERFEDVRGDFHLDISMTPIFDQDKVVQVAVLGVDITAGSRPKRNCGRANRGSGSWPRPSRTSSGSPPPPWTG